MKLKLIFILLIIYLLSNTSAFSENGIIDCETYFDIGIKLFNEQCYPEAIELFKKSVGIEENDTCRLFLAKCYIYNFQYSLAIIELKKIMAINKEAKELLDKYLLYTIPLEYYGVRIGSSEEEVKSKLKNKFLSKEDYNVEPKGIDVFIYDITKTEKAAFKFKNNQLYEINIDFENNTDFIKTFGIPSKKYLYYKDIHQEIWADLWEDNIGQILLKEKKYTASNTFSQSLTISHKNISEEVELTSKSKYLNLWY